MHAPQPPYALATPTFRFRALAAAAGRAPLGGGREVALASYLAARLVDDARPGSATALPAVVRETRAKAARGWLAALTLPAALRVPLARLVDATAADAAAMLAALDGVIALTAEHLDPAARSELQQLARALT